jgi:hypothetical protein
MHQSSVKFQSATHCRNAPTSVSAPLEFCNAAKLDVNILVAVCVVYDWLYITFNQKNLVLVFNQKRKEGLVCYIKKGGHYFLFDLWE